jgi:uncharacterized protein
MKYLLVIVVVAVVLWLTLGRRPRARARPPKAQPALEGMVRCAHCGMHLPRSEALTAGADAYCSAAHRDAGPRTDA